MSSDPASGRASHERLPDDARLVVSFSHTLLSGWGFLREPRVRVWIEDADGAPVRVLLERSAHGLVTMAQWYAALGRVHTTTSGTKSAGATQVEWDGTDAAGSRVAVGDYVVCIEAAREQGPRELVRERVTLGQERFVRYLATSGELIEAAVYYGGAIG